LDRTEALKLGERLVSLALADIRNSFELVKEFMVKFGHPVYGTPRLIEDKGWEDMRVGLIEEELEELKAAVEARDIVGIADALGDLEYVVNGMALGCGINLPAVVKEIHRSNMTKLGPDGKPIYREDGKILKGKDYEPPNLEKVLGL
jgi:predicted HAD superfamily Cof-like phosphohydrolase